MLRTLSLYLWLLPFGCFLTGYLVVSMCYHTDNVPAPHLIGKTTQEALRTCASENATMRLLEEKIDDSLPEGIVVEQDPAPATPIKKDGAVWCIVSKKPTRTIPELRGLTVERIAHVAAAAGMNCTHAYLPSNAPCDTCFAQYPHANTPITDAQAVAYIAQEAVTHVIMPNCVGHFLTDVIQFLHEHGCTPELFYQTPQASNHQCRACTVVGQYPKAGTLIKTDQIKKLHVQLHVHCQA